MTVRPLLIAPDPRLLVKSAHVDVIDDDIKTLADDMLETMRHSNGLGLAAVQINVHKRIFIADIPDCENYRELEEIPGYEAVGGPYIIINPEIIEFSHGDTCLKEGCLSVPEQSANITRAKCITIEYTNLQSERVTLKAQNWLAKCCLHENDHLNGIVFFDLLSDLKKEIAIRKANKIKKHYV